MRRLLLVVPCIALVAARATCGEGSAPGVSVKLRREGAALRVSIENALPEALFLGGCNQYVIERRDGDSWRVARQRTCVWEGFAVPVEAGATWSAVEDLEGLAPGDYRAVVAYALGCKREEPLSRAGCREQGSATSATLAVE